MNPASLRALMSRGVHHQQRGEYAEAERLYSQILAAAPTQADAHNFMGLLAHQTGRQALAESHMQQSITLEPKRAEFHYNYGGVLAAIGKTEHAAQEFQVAVDIAPGMTGAWQGLGMALKELKLEMHAAVCFQRVLSAEPRRAEIWLQLGECFQPLSMFAEAAEAYRRAQALQPDDPRIQLAVATNAMDTGDGAASLAAMDKLLAMAPDMPETHYQRGVWFANRGEFESARAALQKALELAPEFYQAALYYAYITPLPLTDPLVGRLTQATKRETWEDTAQGANAHFTLGYLLDKAGQHDPAFQHYLEANRLQRLSHRYSTESQVQFQRSVLQAFDAGFLARAKRFGNPSSKPIFIVGMPRSGTSLLEQMLSSHPDVHGGGEMTVLHAELRRRLGPGAYGNFSAAVAAMPDAELADIAATVLMHMERMAPGKRHVTDKMPSNFVLLGLIHALFPNARIIHCRRDPLDTCVSCFVTSFKLGNKFSNDLHELGEYQRIYDATMAHWKQLFPTGTIHEIRYEALVADMEGELRKLLAFCGLEWDPACLDFQDNARAVSTASVYQVRQPIYNSAIGRWKRYERHLGPLQEALSGAPLL